MKFVRFEETLTSMCIQHTCKININYINLVQLNFSIYYLKKYNDIKLNVFIFKMQKIFFKDKEFYLYENKYLCGINRSTKR